MVKYCQDGSVIRTGQTKVNVAAIPANGYKVRLELDHPRRRAPHRNQEWLIMKRWKWIITGGVQGVGFRPFVYKSALGAAVTGHVGNTAEGVVIEIQGRDEQLAAFEDLFAANLPPLARIVGWERAVMEPVPGETAFSIRASTGGAGHQVLISPDVATCDDCLRDTLDPNGRRFHYPFTNCTNCGPRYTITRSIPYDRASTSMACFPMCPDCRAEYTDPLDRRFHAQPNACPVCGPRVWLADREGARLAEGEEALVETARLLRDGRIMAMKGLGGFHLACDARDVTAVGTLRQRKNRRDKPLAVMVRDLDAARILAQVGADEARLLSGAERPIVLVPSKPEAGLAPDLSPDTAYLGLMLPYTPLHHVLFDLLAETAPDAPAALVMTSGNASSDPICLGNREALARLAGIADYFLFHDRDILIRCDDSVLRWAGDAPQFIRRARGFTPSPIDLATDGPTVLGVGPLLKNTLCLTKGRQAFVSQHIGDLENLGALAFFREIAAHLADILQVRPEAVVHDLHPDYMSTTYARESGLPCLALQHHFAHIHAVLAENRHQGPALGLALDGTGLGDDGTIWGGEALFVDTAKLEHRRLARFAQVRLPGGDSAAREPWRMARAYLHALGLTTPAAAPWRERFGAADRIVGQMLDKGLNSPLTSSCGRLFDAVAGMLGLCLDISYEGQAAILLEAEQDKTETSAYVCPIVDREGPRELDTLTLFAQVHADWRAGEPAGRISRRFHLGLMNGLAALCAELARETGCTHVGLSGGVMHNLTLATELPRRLRDQGLTALTHRQLPPSDACISLGQAAYGRLAQHL